MDDTPVVSEQDVLKIADMCPRAMPAYFCCVRSSDEYGESTISKKYIVNELGRSWTKFRNDLRSLMGLRILDFYDYNDVVEVELLGGQYDRCML